MSTPVVTNAPRWVRIVLRDRRGAADGLIALVLAVAALISVKAVYDEMSDMDALFRVPRAFPIVLSMLALTGPLAWRRRYPLGAAIAVVTGFLVARVVVHVPEESVTMLVAFMAFYSAAVHGRRPLGVLRSAGL